MENIKRNSLTTDELNRVAEIISDSSANTIDLFRFFNWLQSIQDDLNKIPSVLNETDSIESGGNQVFPPLPLDKLGLLFLSSGTYEATVIGGADKWRRLYDGTAFDPASILP